jgi:ribosomal protein S18 acetylase RimI-like enzyme
MTTIRDMELDDIPAAFSVRTSTRENPLTLVELEEDYELTPETLASAMLSTAKGWVCEADGKVVGFSMGDSTNAELTVIAVLPDYEGRGIGKRLLSEVENWLFSLGHKELWLVTTPDPDLRAYNFYVKRGWVPTGG